MLVIISNGMQLVSVVGQLSWRVALYTSLAITLICSVQYSACKLYCRILDLCNFSGRAVEALKIHKLSVMLAEDSDAWQDAAGEFCNMLHIRRQHIVQDALQYANTASFRYEPYDVINFYCLSHYNKPLFCISYKCLSKITYALFHFHTKWSNIH